MPNSGDLSHINKQIQKDTADVKYARQQITIQQTRADQKHHEGDRNEAAYHEREADRFEQQAEALEAEIDQLQTEKTRVEKRIAELELQRAGIDPTHTDRIAQINRELIQLRGSNMML